MSLDFELSKDDMARIDSLDGGMHSIDNQIREPVNTDRLLSELVYKNFSGINYTRKYKLFGFIPFLKIMRKSSRVIRCYLFGIQILKIETKPS